MPDRFTVTEVLLPFGRTFRELSWISCITARKVESAAAAEASASAGRAGTSVGVGTCMGSISEMVSTFMWLAFKVPGVSLGGNFPLK